MDEQLMREAESVLARFGKPKTDGPGEIQLAFTYAFQFAKRSHIRTRAAVMVVEHPGFDLHKVGGYTYPAAAGAIYRLKAGHYSQDIPGGLFACGAFSILPAVRLKPGDTISVQLRIPPKKARRGGLRKYMGRFDAMGVKVFKPSNPSKHPSSAA